MSQPGAIRLSVVIGSHNTIAVIEPCLAALAPQMPSQPVEVIVADSSDDGTGELIAARFPWVRLIRFDRPQSVPVLRGRGIAAAGGDIIAVLDPYSVAAPDWIERVIEAHARQRHMVIGGSVGLYRAESSSWADRILYFNEYGMFMPPVRTGEAWIVPGSNVSYKRAALFDDNGPRYPVFWKTFTNWELEGGGSPLWLSDDVRVDLNKPIPLHDYLRTRYDHGRCFGGMRGAHASLGERLWRMTTSPLIPIVLLWRWTRDFWPKRRRRLDYLLTMPAQLLLFAVWAYGEASGYARGAGRCCDRLYY